MNLDKLKAQLSTEEGRRLKPYVDTVGKVTIGVGRNLTDKGISADECDLMLSNDIREATIAAASFPWFADLNESRQAVIVDMIFNMGLGGFQQFRNMIAAIARGDYTGASAEMLKSGWAGQVGGRANHLSDQMESGVW